MCSLKWAKNKTFHNSEIINLSYEIISPNEEVSYDSVKISPPFDIQIILMFHDLISICRKMFY